MKSLVKPLLKYTGNPLNNLGNVQKCRENHLLNVGNFVYNLRQKLTQHRHSSACSVYQL